MPTSSTLQHILLGVMMMTRVFMKMIETAGQAGQLQQLLRLQAGRVLDGLQCVSSHTAAGSCMERRSGTPAAAAAEAGAGAEGAVAELLLLLLLLRRQGSHTCCKVV
jgi:hypothetical protein